MWWHVSYVPLCLFMGPDMWRNSCFAMKFCSQELHPRFLCICPSVSSFLCISPLHLLAPFVSTQPRMCLLVWSAVPVFDINFKLLHFRGSQPRGKVDLFARFTLFTFQEQANGCVQFLILPLRSLLQRHYFYYWVPRLFVWALMISERWNYKMQRV